MLSVRYRLGERIGSGSSGSVYRASDPSSGADVAVKIARISSAEDRRRFVREALALRLLRIPGVVELLDHGEEGDTAFLVTRLVEGRPFPGVDVPASPDVVEELASVLLGTLARVHRAGIIHRDLKPANILVSDGRPTLLDFGLARGQPLGDTLTARGEMLGTLRYAAPEQILGGRVDGRTDLYSLAVVLWEALTGAGPHAGPDWVGARLHREPPSVASVVPRISERLARAIDGMLTREPDRRWRSAEAAALALERGPRRFQRLGRTEPLDAVVAALRNRRSVDIGGERGSGRTRLLEDALNAVQVRVMRVPAGRAPFESVRALVPELADRPEASFDEAAAIVRERLTRVLSTHVLVTDGSPDPWSSGEIDALRAVGTVVRVVDGAGDVAPPRLSPEELRALFWGPDSVLHLREDAANLLYSRTSGHAGSVVTELGAWIRLGRAHIEGDRVRVERDDLDGLAAEAPRQAAIEAIDGPAADLLAWLELVGVAIDASVLRALTGLAAWQIGALLADLMRRGAIVKVGSAFQALEPQRQLAMWPDDQVAAARTKWLGLSPVGTPGRLLHAILAESPEVVAQEALWLAARDFNSSRPAAASRVLEVAIAAVVAHHREDLAGPLAAQLARVAIAQWSASALDRASALASRVFVGNDVVTTLAAASRAVRGDGAGALELLSASGLDGADASPLAEACAVITVQACSRLPADAREAVLRRVVGRGDANALAHTIRGLVAYHDGLWLESIVHHQRAAATAERLAPRLSARLNAAAAALELGDWASVTELAGQVRKEAADARLPPQEARAACLLRAAEYRSGGSPAADPELIVALERLGASDLLGWCALIDASVALRRGDLGGAAFRADLAARHYGSVAHRPAAMLAQSLAVAARETTPSTELLGQIERCPIAGIRAQCAALVRRGSAPDAAIGVPTSPGRREILSLDEILGIAPWPVPRTPGA